MVELEYHTVQMQGLVVAETYRLPWSHMPRVANLASLDALGLLDQRYKALLSTKAPIVLQLHPLVTPAAGSEERNQAAKKFHPGLKATAFGIARGPSPSEAEVDLGGHLGQCLLTDFLVHSR